MQDMNKECKDYNKGILDELREASSMLAYIYDGEESPILHEEVILNIHGNYLGVELLRTTGGPGCIIDTKRGVIRTAWGDGRHELPLPQKIIDAIDAIVCEMHQIISD